MATRRSRRGSKSRRQSNKRSQSSSSGGSSSTKALSSGSSRRGGRRGGRRSGGAQKSSGANPRAVREKANWESLVYGAVASLGFGFLQSKVALPGIAGVPNSLTYGVGAVAAGVVMNSDVMLRAGSGPLMAGLHNLALKGFTNAEQLSGEFDSLEGEESAGEFDGDQVAGEFDSGDTVEGEFEEVAAGTFDDL